MRFLILILSLMFILPACQKHPLQQLGATKVSQKLDSYKLKGGEQVIVDILFVIDTSGSMTEEQEKLVNNISKFMAKLKASADKTKYHIGVMTTSLYTDSINNANIKQRIKDKEDGRLMPIVTGNVTTFPTGSTGGNFEDCDNNSGDKKFLTNEDNDNVEEYLRNTIKCLGQAGVSIERPFDVLENFLVKHEEYNSGFIRDEAKLMIILISDEDDCSNGIDDAGNPIANVTSKECVERFQGENKLKNLNHYLDLLKEKKGSYNKIGFSAIVGPHFCWSGNIDDMGSTTNAVYPYMSCKYSGGRFSEVYNQNFSQCGGGISKPCNCGSDAEVPVCPNDIFMSCYNDLATGLPNVLPTVSDEPCSESSLYGKCDPGKHCEVTEHGVKCVDDTCSAANPTGTCSVDKYCNNGTCENKVVSFNNILNTDEGKDHDQINSSKISLATPGSRYLKFYELLKNKKKNENDLYKYSICLEDYGSPLGLIGAKLAEAKCEYNLQSKTDDPCNLVIRIEAENLPEELKNNLSFGKPWVYVIEKNITLEEDVAGHSKGDAVTSEILLNICKSNSNKAFSDRVKISKYLEKSLCDKQAEGDKAECLRLLFPNKCPEPGSNVSIFYGVEE